MDGQHRIGRNLAPRPRGGGNGHKGQGFGLPALEKLQGIPVIHRHEGHGLSRIQGRTAADGNDVVTALFPGQLGTCPAGLGGGVVFHLVEEDVITLEHRQHII